ncbi:Retrovirus-related Pol polyprotein from transposon TNT 1-94 [Eumeta japonica]|uniref:Retrovirus-related Pol polyprotein from transposon TNT 1-94 n=1 Tax=Eumeta variegata TaxID=151549 RepID=A0A4C1TKH8_EUMVA|nr:Retrovirus-related Pol polyprotein from transposon TNT 1-94 [Eumeta japonica]
MPVLYSGSVDIVTITPRNKYQVTINDVLCVPNLATNLISVSKLIQNGNSVNFTKNGGYIYNKKGELVAVAELIDGMYKVNTENRHCLFTSPSAVSSEVWHRRLGHLNSNDLNKMKDGAVTGMDYKDKAVIDKSTCVVCCEGKQSRLPFNHVGTRSTETLHTVHADLCDPMETTSIGGCRYYLILVDDYTRMAIVYFLKAKNQAFKYFKEFKSLVENQQNKKIKIFRTDNGLEFCSNEFEGYLTDAGIIHQKTNTYTPEQNAVSERMNRTIVERARCMLFDARLDKSFWPEAVNTAVYLRNRSVAIGLNNRTPFELWTNKKPDLSHIRIFGSQVILHIPKERRLKWDTKSKLHILVGYAENIKGYRIYDPDKRSVVISRDVIIQENLEKKVMNEVKSSDETNNELVNPDTSLESEYEDVETDLDSTLQEAKQEKQQEINERVRRPPERFGYSNLCTSSNEKLNDPVTVQEALQSSCRDKWIAAMNEELEAFKENNAWTEVDKVPSDKTIIQCKWVFKRN